VGHRSVTVVWVALAIPACDEPARIARATPAPPCPDIVAVPERDESGPFPKAGPVTVSASDRTAQAGTADDPAIWVHPTDPSQSLVIGTDKRSSGGLHVFDLDGNTLQFVAGGRHNNADVRYGFPLAGGRVDLVSACDRNTNAIDVYVMDPVTRRLGPAGTIQTGLTVYGYAMYHSRPTGKYYGIVSSENGVEQWEFIGQSDGTVSGVLVRSYASSTLIEGIVADDELGYVYLAEENTGIHKYHADPGQPTTRLATVDWVGSTTQLVADVEGLTIYYRRDGRGYLIASSQGNHQFNVYRREGNNEYLGTFTVTQARDTDGIDVNSAALGSLFPQGIFVAQNDDTDFPMVRWQDIASTLGLAIDTTGYDARGDRGDCADADSIGASPGNRLR